MGHPQSLTPKFVWATRPAASANESDGIDVEEKGSGTTIGRGFGIKDMSLPEGEVECLHSIRVLVEEVA